MVSICFHWASLWFEENAKCYKGNEMNLRNSQNAWLIRDFVSESFQRAMLIVHVSEAKTDHIIGPLSQHSQTSGNNNDCLSADVPGFTNTPHYFFALVPLRVMQWDMIFRGHSPVIKTQLPLRPLCLLAGEEVSRGFPGGWAVGGGGGATAGLPGRLQIHLCLYRCRGILMVRLVLHFNKPSMVRAHAKFHFPHS